MILKLNKTSRKSTQILRLSKLNRLLWETMKLGNDNRNLIISVGSRAAAFPCTVLGKPDRSVKKFNFNIMKELIEDAWES